MVYAEAERGGEASLENLERGAEMHHLCDAVAFKLSMLKKKKRRRKESTKGMKKKKKGHLILYSSNYRGFFGGWSFFVFDFCLLLVLSALYIRFTVGQCQPLKLQLSCEVD